MSSTPLTEEVAGALAKFFSGTRGPSHLEIDETFRRANITDLDPRATAKDPIGKEVRIRTALGAAARSAGVNGE